MSILEKLKLLFKELLGKDLTDDQVKKLEETVSADKPTPPTTDTTTSVTIPANLQNSEDMKIIIKLFEEQKSEIAKERAAREDLMKRIDEDKKQQIKIKADQVIADAIKNKKIAPKDDEEKKKWEKRLSENYDDAVELLGKLPALTFKDETPQGQTQTTIQTNGSAQTASRVDLMKNVANVFKQNKE